GEAGRVDSGRGARPGPGSERAPALACGPRARVEPGPGPAPPPRAPGGPRARVAPGPIQPAGRAAGREAPAARLRPASPDRLQALADAHGHAREGRRVADRVAAGLGVAERHEQVEETAHVVGLERDHE